MTGQRPHYNGVCGICRSPNTRVIKCKGKTYLDPRTGKYYVRKIDIPAWHLVRGYGHVCKLCFDRLRCRGGLHSTANYKHTVSKLKLLKQSKHDQLPNVVTRVLNFYLRSNNIEIMH
jgi:hypothetical protein